MIANQHRSPCLFTAAPARRILACLAFVLAIAPAAHGVISWSGGTNSVPPNQHDSSIQITGGINTVQAGGVLTLDVFGTMEMTGASLTLNSDASTPGTLAIAGLTIASHASGVTSSILNGGAAAMPGKLDLNSSTVTFAVESGAVPSSGPDLSISGKVTNGGMSKTGPGILALSGTNNYAGGTTLSAGTIYINSSTAVGTGDLSITGPGTKIDNRSGGTLTLANPLGLTGGDLTFTGTNDLIFGTGFSVIAGGDRSINITNPAATLTLGGPIGDNGQKRMLISNGPGTLRLTGNSLYTGGTTVAGGTLDLTGSVSSGVTVNSGATLTGAGTIQGSLLVNAGGTVDINGGTLTVQGAITNNGLFILSNGAQVAGNTGFVNNGALDVITAGGTPPNLTNNGTIIDASVVKTKSVSRSGSTLTITIDSYTGHTYQLQKSTTSPGGSSFTTNVGSAQQGTTSTVLTFTDPGATGSQSYYRILVNP